MAAATPVPVLLPINTKFGAGSCYPTFIQALQPANGCPALSSGEARKGAAARGPSPGLFGAAVPHFTSLPPQERDVCGEERQQDPHLPAQLHPDARYGRSPRSQRPTEPLPAHVPQKLPFVGTPRAFPTLTHGSGGRGHPPAPHTWDIGARGTHRSPVVSQSLTGLPALPVPSSGGAGGVHG